MLIRLFKIFLALASALYTVQLFSVGYLGAGIGMVILTILLVLTSLRSMRLVMAFVYLRQQKMDEKLIDYVYLYDVKEPQNYL